MVARTQWETDFAMEALCQYACGKMLSKEEDSRKNFLITEMSNINSGRAEEDFIEMLVLFGGGRSRVAALREQKCRC